MKRPFRFARNTWRRILATAHYSLAGSVRGPFSIEHTEEENILRELAGSSLEGPSLTVYDVENLNSVNFVADPFLFVTDDALHLFFEVRHSDRKPTASIGHAVSRDQGHYWEYDGIVFEIDTHVSYPYIFRANGEIYLLPDIANTAGDLAPARLYKAVDFPSDWEAVVDIIDTNHACTDTTVFEYDDRWWAITSAGQNNKLRVYYNDTLEKSQWSPHRNNPVVTGRPSAGRPAGRPVIRDTIVAFFQDSKMEYGASVRAYEISELSPTSYRDRPLLKEPILGGTGTIGWNSGRMHHIDLQWHEGTVYCAVDGDVGLGRNRLSGSLWSIGIGTSCRDR